MVWELAAEGKEDGEEGVATTRGPDHETVQGA